MHKRSFLAIALVALSSSNTVRADVLKPAAVKVGFIDLYPVLQVDERYDDNLYLQADQERSSALTVVAPAIKAEALDGPNVYSLDYRAEAGFFDRSQDDNYVDQLAAAKFHWEPSSRHSLDLRGIYQRDHDRRGSAYFEGDEAFSIDEPARYRRETLLGRYVYGADEARGRIELELRGSDKTYINHRELTLQRDRRELGATTTFLWRLAGRTSALLEVSRSSIDYKNEPTRIVGVEDTLDSITTAYLAGVTWKFAGKTSGTIKVGHVEKDFMDRDREDFSGTSWSGEITWSPRTYSKFTLLGGRRTDESKGSGDYIDATDLGLDWRHEWSEKFATTLHYLHSDEDFEQHPDGREDEISVYGLRADYAFRRWLAAGVFYDHDRRDSNIRELNYTRNLVGITLRASL